MRITPTFGIGDPCKVHPTEFESLGGDYYLQTVKGVYNG